MPKTILDYKGLINIGFGLVTVILALVFIYNGLQFDLYTAIVTIFLLSVVIILWYIWRHPSSEAVEDQKQKLGWVDKLAHWIITKAPEIFLVVLFTFIVAALFSAFPFPAPEMTITVPNTSLPVKVIVNPERGVLGWDGKMLYVNVTASPGIRCYVLYNSEFFQRVIRNLHWDPKI